ncbi:MAG: endonuclease/exonuclease/phosphatase family protein [Clostridia bacterium]|nr:endonuclease/exonuclease/phosphatase family protein [Clostridia bacterium]
MDLNLVSFNIRSLDDPDGYSIPERAPRLSKVIRDIDPDIIGIQEFRPSWEKLFHEHFLDRYEMYNRYRTLEGWIEGCPILWKKDLFDLEDKGIFWFSDTPEVESQGWDELGHKRIGIYVLLKDLRDGSRFVSMNTHFGFGDDCQIKSARILKDYADRFADLPLFITGDFNARPESHAYKEMTKHFRDVNAMVLNDWGDTYHGYYVSEDPPEHIDYCFINDHVEPISERVIREKVDGYFPSDHYGLQIELKI